MPWKMKKIQTSAAFFPKPGFFTHTSFPRRREPKCESRRATENEAGSPTGASSLQPLLFLTAEIHTWISAFAQCCPRSVLNNVTPAKAGAYAESRSIRKVRKKAPSFRCFHGNSAKPPVRRMDSHFRGNDESVMNGKQAPASVNCGKRLYFSKESDCEEFSLDTSAPSRERRAGS